MSGTFRIQPLLDLPDSLDGLRAEAAGDGFRLLERFVAEWHVGTNRFAKPGEVCLGAFRAADLIALGGLNRDPYVGPEGIGRLRHLYVRKSARRAGVGATLVRLLLDHAAPSFHTVRIRTDTQEAAAFYAALGFDTVEHYTATHVIATHVIATNRYGSTGRTK